eukprot:g3337.t1
MKLCVFSLLLLIGPVAVKSSSSSSSSSSRHTVFYDKATDTAHIRSGILKGGSAHVTYSPGLFQDGWNKLEVWGRVKDGQMHARGAGYSTGYAEGHVTQESIWVMFKNNYADWFVDQGDANLTPDEAYRWLLANWNYTKSSAESVLSRGSDKDFDEERTYWSLVMRSVHQLEGLLDGYNDAAPTHQKLTLGDVLLLNADGDLESIQVALGSPSLRSKGPREERCSSMFKLADDNSDVFFGHTTWDHFDMMIRQLKTYSWSADYEDRAKQADDDGGEIVTFSSSPGFLTSVDDFYLTSRGLAVIETTNGNMNATLWDLLTERSVLSWVRCYVANAAAADADSWTSFFGRENSGTYNNQWMVFDMNAFLPGQPLSPNTFLIVEQIPGELVVEDRSAWLNENRYWGSYNIPAIPTVWKKSGFGAATPTWRYNHSECPRAHYMRQLNASVVDLSSFQRMIRYNNFGNDSNPHDAWAGYGVSARFDLLSHDDENFGLFGGIDGKASSVMLAKQGLTFTAQNGPSHDGQPPFDWRTAGKPYPNSKYNKPPSHEGMPEVWDFEWVRYEWNATSLW